MVRKIIWTERAENVFVEILRFYNKKNKSKVFSRELNNELKKTINIIAKQPFLGIRTEREKIRLIIKGNYKIFYQIEPNEIVILLVWDTRQNPNNLKI